MRKWIVLGLVVLLLGFLCGKVFAEIDIPEEPLPVLNKAQIDTVIIHYPTRQARVDIRKGYMDGENFVMVGGKEQTFLFVDVDDDLNTPEDETKTDFTDFVESIKLDKKVLKNIIKGKL